MHICTVDIDKKAIGQYVTIGLYKGACAERPGLSASGEDSLRLRPYQAWAAWWISGMVCGQGQRDRHL